MKKILFSLIFLFTTILVFAQRTVDTIYLKNGSVIKGIISELIPNESIKVQTRDGSLFVYQWNEVSKITRGLQQNTSTTTINKENFFNFEKINPGLRGIIEAGYTAGNNNCGRFEFTPALGYRINSYLFLGAGAGLNYYTTSDVLMLPMYGDIRGFLPLESSIHPYLDIKPGYSFHLSKNTTTNGFYINFTAGIEISHFTVGIGYASQKLTTSFDDWGSFSVSTGGFSIKIGTFF